MKNNAVSNLLKIINDYHLYLPTDSRTPKKTSRKKSNKKEMEKNTAILEFRPILAN